MGLIGTIRNKSLHLHAFLKKKQSILVTLLFYYESISFGFHFLMSYEK